ncbi:hypothetical protein K504DRAFT_534559 [Pleomassaria siparia CBS 279.74]|uniref:SprT-like domain-containing protein n=1 Tax=Pleomassaria siparia CBS 279.74 TaxID=1314801 RepID=A0A6G1K870_9PLEO|nr:hypothetical protein K504DRAFT_534559 [Pleomassaria siparia CBS 279.74]
MFHLSNSNNGRLSISPKVQDFTATTTTTPVKDQASDPSWSSILSSRTKDLYGRNPKPNLAQNPSDVVELSRQLGDGAKCICGPCLDKLNSKCSRRPHRDILLWQDTKNRFGYRGYKVPQWSSVDYRYDAMHLAESCVRYWDRPIETLNETQITNLRELLRFVIKYEDELDHADARHGLRHEHLKWICNRFNHIFFFGAVRNLTCEWGGLGKDVLGLTSPGHGQMKIQLHPTLVLRGSEARPQSPGVSRLNVALHEMIHAFTAANSCRHCPGDLDDHGKNFQMIAQRMEQVGERMLGWRPQLGRLVGLWSDIRSGGEVPSYGQLRAWGMVDSEGNAAYIS